MIATCGGMLELGLSRGDVLVSFGIGTLASVVAAVITNLFMVWRARQRYDLAIGEYVGFGFEDDEANPLVQRPKSQSTAKVAHVRRNILRIQVLHGDRSWDGDVAMEHEMFGAVVWKYSDYPEGMHAFGFKRLMVRLDRDRVYLYLLGEPPFGKEVFIRPR